MILAMHNIAQTLNDLKPLKAVITKRATSVFDRVLSTPLVSLSYTYESGRVLGVGPLHKNDFKF